jgi:hypothetical protein
MRKPRAGNDDCCSIVTLCTTKTQRRNTKRNYILIYQDFTPRVYTVEVERGKKKYTVEKVYTSRHVHYDSNIARLKNKNLPITFDSVH